MRMTPLEMKLGVVQLAETLAFLHMDANLVHCGINPQVGLIYVETLLHCHFFHSAKAVHLKRATLPVRCLMPSPP